MMQSDRPSVLIVDDEVEITELYAEWLSDDYDVVTANDGAEALAALDGSPDVVLLDRRMPGRSGEDLLQEIRERGIDARVAMVTAVSPDVDVVAMGFDDYLVKPVTGDELVDTVDRLLQVAAYDHELRTFYSLATKKALLEAERPREVLDRSDAYADLCRRVDEARARLDDIGCELGKEEFHSLFRGLDDGFTASS